MVFKIKDLTYGIVDHVCNHFTHKTKTGCKECPFRIRATTICFVKHDMEVNLGNENKTISNGIIDIPMVLLPADWIVDNIPFTILRSLSQDDQKFIDIGYAQYAKKEEEKHGDN